MGTDPPATAGSSVRHHTNSATAPHTTYPFPVGRLLGLVPISKVA